MRFLTDQRRLVSRRQALGRTGAAGAGLAALFVAACGGDNANEKEPGNPAAGAATQGTVASAASETPKRGGVLNLSTINAMPNLDIHKQTVSLVHGVNIAPAYGRLLRYQVGPGIVGKRIPAPDLASKWEQVDPKTYTFQIHPNARFHNVAPVNGRQATADDVIFSFNRQIAERTNSLYLANIDTMTAVDPKTLRITTKQVDGDFLATVSASWNKIVAREVVEKYGDLREAPVIGTGAFVVDSIQPGSVTLKRNPDYHIPERPFLDGIKYTQIDDRTTTQAAFRTGAIHALIVSKPELDSALKENSKIGVQKWPSSIGYGATVSAVGGPNADPRVRRALMLAVNRKQVIDAIWFGLADLTTSLSIDDDMELPKSDLESLLAYDPKAASDLLKAAGATNWEPKFSIWNNPDAQPGGELVEAMWRQIGLKPAVDVVDSTKSVALRSTGEGLVILWSAWPGVPNITFDLNARWKTGSTQNGTKFSDPAFDRLIDAQALELDVNKRKQLLLDIQRRLFTEICTIQPAARPTETTALAPQVRNFNWTPFQTYDHLTEIWFSS